jgi:integrase
VPRMDPVQWAVIAQFVRDAVTTAAPQSAYSAHRLFVTVAGYVQWAHFHAGMPLDARILFRREIIARYMSRNPRNLTDGTRRNYRSMLLRVSEVISPDYVTKPMAPLNGRTILPPHSPKELNELRDWARGQNTLGKRLKASTLLALIAGAGLRPIEVAELHRRDILFDAEGVLVRIHNEAGSRTVPLLAEWEALLEWAVSEVAENDLVFGMPNRKTYKNLLSGFVVHTVGKHKPRSDRLRASWLVYHLSAGTPMKALMEAADITKFLNLERYLQFVPELDSLEYRRILRAEASK